MACYTFTLGNKEFTIKNSNKNSDANSGIYFLQALQQLADTDKNTYIEIVKALGEIQTSPNVKRFDSRDARDLPYILQENLAQYGITLNVLKDSVSENQVTLNEFCVQHNINPDAKAFVFQGQIYIHGDTLDVGAAMHELTHLFLAVLKTKNFKQYQDLIHTLYQHPMAQQLSKELKSIPTYSENYDLDFEEEVIVRIFEAIYNNKIDPKDLEFDYNGETIDILNLFDENLKPIIQNTLGIQKYPGIITFMSSMIADIPSFQNTFAQKTKLSPGTNFNIEQIAKETAGISELINFLSQDDLPNEFAEEKIEKGDCK